MYIDDFIRAKRPLGYWKELLQEWIFMIHRVYRVSKGRTSVHAEKERANTGLLAAAATRNGWVALEECRTEKIDRFSKRYTYSGRCDLVLWRDRRHHEIEAKFARISISARSNSRISKAHTKALSDSSRSTSSGYGSEKKIAITYVVPVIKPNLLEKLSQDDISLILKDMIKEIKLVHNPTLLAYTFPGPVSLEGSPNFGLGVILMGDVT